MKVCTKCNEEKALDSFYNRTASLDGKSPICKSCVGLYKKQYRIDNPEKFPRKSIRYYDLPENMRRCATCKEIKTKDSFSVSNRLASGVSTYCRSCTSLRNKKRNSIPSETRLVARRAWAAANREKLREQERLYREANRESKRLTEAKRRARKKALPDTLTLEEVEVILNHFDGLCAICEADAQHLDHFIPLASGFGGTTMQNIVPMCRRCNNSKHAKNPFVWAASLNKYERERFRRLVMYLTELNGIAAVEDYEAHVTQCFK